MSDENEITLNCAFDSAVYKGFRIYIDDRVLIPVEHILSSPFFIKEKIATGKHRLKLVQNLSLENKYWWALAILDILMAFFGPDEEKSTGPFFAVAEGEIAVNGDAEVTIRLSDIDRYKMKHDLIRDCRFHVEATRHCSWEENKNYVTTTPKYKRRWYITVITPIVIIFGFLILLFSALGIPRLFSGDLFIGLFCMLLSALTIFGLIGIILKIVKSVQLKR